ncbi:MAG: hypothetical protein KDE27_20805, partial [Planctomycetes bacterium]|nr:hypothetical protein [Planctomycetota bacterium]
MNIRIPIASLAAALASVLPAQNQRLSTTVTHQASSAKGWYANITVTNPNGIVLNAIDIAQAVPGTGNQIEFYLREGAATAANRTSTAGWVLHSSVHVSSATTVGAFDIVNIDDVWLAPGTHGIAITRTCCFQSYETGLTTHSNADVTFTGVGSTANHFSTWPDDQTICCRLNYFRGEERTVATTPFVNGSPSLEYLSASPADIDGKTGGTGGFLHRYYDHTAVTLNAPPASGSYFLQRWEVNGVAQTIGDASPTVVADQDLVANAYYEREKTVRVDATLDGTVITPTIAIAPDDLYGNSSTTAPGSFAALRDQTIALTADAEIDQRYVFRRWLQDGVALPSQRGTLTTTVPDDTDIVAEYMDAPCYDTDLGAPLGAGDETLAIGIDLGFEFALPDGTTTSSIDICSNGFVWLVSGSSTDTDNTPTRTELGDGPPRLAPFWADLDFTGGASDVWFRAADDRAIVTWHDARFAGGTETFTVQCQIFAGGAVWITWGSDVPVTGTSAVGISQGGGASQSHASFWFTGYSTTTAQSVTDEYSDDFDLQGLATSLVPFRATGWAYHQLACDGGATLLYGNGCGLPTAFYEVGTGATIGAVALELTPNADGGYDVADCGQGSFDTDLGTLQAIDDEDMEILNLPFAFPYPGNTAGSTSMRVCSNGFIWLDANSHLGYQYQATIGNLLNSPARLAPMWTDLNPPASTTGGVYFKVLPDRAVITWFEVPEFSHNVPLT